MNSLSWFLYLADVIPSLGGVFVLMCVCCIMFYVVGAWIVGMEYSDREKVFTPFYRKHRKKVFIFCILFAFIASVTPTQRTMYLILGSETTEAAMNSETGQRVLNAVNKKLDEYLTEGE